MMRNNRKRTHRGRFVGFLVAAVAFSLTACESRNGSLVFEDFDNSPTVTINGVQLLKAPAGLRLASSASVQMDQSGGTIRVDGAWLAIPSGALSGNTTITMANGSDLWAYDLGPHGLTFNSSATLTVKITQAELTQLGVDPSALAVAYATNGNSNNWQILGGSYDPVEEEIDLPVDHFSVYALCVE